MEGLVLLFCCAWLAAGAAGLHLSIQCQEESEASLSWPEGKCFLHEYIQVLVFSVQSCLICIQFSMCFSLISSYQSIPRNCPLYQFISIPIPFQFVIQLSNRKSLTQTPQSGDDLSFITFSLKCAESQIQQSNRVQSHM